MSDPRMGWSDAVMYGVEEDPLLRSVITVVVLLDEAPDEAVVTERLDRVTRIVPKLRQRVIGNPLSLAPPRWEIDPNFDLNYHIRFIKVDNADGTLRPVFRLAETLAEQDFDHARPLWEATVVNGVGDGQAAFLFKIHHSITDGVGGMQMVAALFDLQRSGNPDLGPEPDAPKGAVAGMRDRLRQGLSFEARTSVSDVRGLYDTSSNIVKDAITDPIGLATSAGEMAQSMSRVLAPANEPLSPVFGERSLSVFFDMICVPLDDLKRAGKSAKGTLNDAYMAGVAGGLRKYHERHGELPEALRVNMPVNQRKPGDTVTEDNAWVPARFPIPLNESDAAKRIQQFHPLLRQARTEPALGLSNQIYRILTVLPRGLATAIAGGLMKGTDFAATNVPGPPIPLYFAGAEVINLLPFAPKGGAALNVALMSYNGTAQIGVNIDTGAIPDPQNLVADLQAGMDEVVAIGEPQKAPKSAAGTGPAKQAPGKSAPAGKPPVKRPVRKQVPAPKPASESPQKAVAKRPPALEAAPAKKAPAKKAPAKKAPAKKAPAKKAPAKKAPAKKAPAKKAPAKKAPAKKAPAKKAPAKKA